MEKAAGKRIEVCPNCGSRPDATAYMCNFDKMPHAIRLDSA